MLFFRWTSSGPQGLPYTPTEINLGNITGAVPISWNTGAVQYATMTGAPTFTFADGVAGGRYTLILAGAFSPVWPADVRWIAGTTPTPSATAGKLDIYSFYKCGVTGLYYGALNPMYATT